MKRYIVVLIEQIWHSLDIDDFSHYETVLHLGVENTVVTFQIGDLIRFFKSKNVKRLPTIIELMSFDKQMSQEGKEFREHSEWRMLSFLQYHRIIGPEFALTSENIKPFLEHAATAFLHLLEKDPSETKRFTDIELNINKLIYHRQLLGIRINKDTAQGKCAQLEKDIYSIKNELQLRFNIFTPDDLKFQRNYLKSKNYRIIDSLLYSFKVKRKEDEVCRLLYELLRNEQDLDSLLYLCAQWGGQERTHPEYYGFGTITSRIIVRQPALQNLRKENRDVILPDNDMRLFYIDYSQFEAGILASMSKDELLINLYNTDIYHDLAQVIFQDKDKRSDAKIIFYRYMYGDQSLNEKEKKYFQKFKKLESFRKSIETEIAKNKKVGTINGNFRFGNGEDHDWALSHVIQATASLIYKNALLRVQKDLRKVEFLIPMHDATLYQLPLAQFDEFKEKTETIYKEEFKKICPLVDPIVTSSDSFTN